MAFPTSNPLTAELMAEIQYEIERVMNGDFDKDAGSEYGDEEIIREKNLENSKREKVVKEPAVVKRY